MKQKLIDYDIFWVHVQSYQVLLPFGLKFKLWIIFYLIISWSIIKIKALNQIVMNESMN
jgi:hypothetical protein